MTCAASATTATAIGPRGVLLSAIDNTSCRPHGHLPSAFQTPPSSVPTRGWFSVWEFLAVTEPASLDLSHDLAADWQEEEERAEEMAHREGVEPVRVQAPEVLTSLGIPTVLLFPDAILRDLFPASWSR